MPFRRRVPRHKERLPPGTLVSPRRAAAAGPFYENADKAGALFCGPSTNLRNHFSFLRRAVSLRRTAPCRPEASRLRCPDGGTGGPSRRAGDSSRLASRLRPSGGDALYRRNGVPRRLPAVPPAGTVFWRRPPDVSRRPQIFLRRLTDVSRRSWVFFRCLTDVSRRPPDVSRHPQIFLRRPPDVSRRRDGVPAAPETEADGGGRFSAPGPGAASAPSAGRSRRSAPGPGPPASATGRWPGPGPSAP